MAATFGGAVSAANRAVVDIAASQSTGAVCQGIASTGADEASISGWRIGASAVTTDLKMDDGDGPGV